MAKERQGCARAALRDEKAKNRAEGLRYGKAPVATRRLARAPQRPVVRRNGNEMSWQNGKGRARTALLGSE